MDSIVLDLIVKVSVAVFYARMFVALSPDGYIPGLLMILRRGLLTLTRVAPVVVGGFLVVACTSDSGIKMETTVTSVPSENALALPPPGGPSVVSILQRGYGNAVQQDIFLFTNAAVPGQNVLKVQFFGDVGKVDAAGDLNRRTLRDVTITNEIRRELPGIAMNRSSYYLQNNYGPFGYAFGRSTGGDACLFAWQRIRSSEKERGFFGHLGEIQIRLRYCDANATQEQLLSVMYGYTLNGVITGPGWNPYGAAPSTDPALNRTGHPVYPPQEATREISRAPVPVRAPVRRVAVRTQDAEPVDQRPAARDTGIPTPTGRVALPSPVTRNTLPGGVTVPSPTCAAQAAGSPGCP